MDNSILRERIQSIVEALDQMDVRGYQNHAIFVACSKELRSILMQLAESETPAEE